eukprot:TRINITY_DN6282_c0_g1_i1.p1 TRINITY_DN6282_c0_g1~~TRINITY_DN6282_c0_g1_i1.p1  ORF type:complete len:484 (-),score=60.31 TRINITY_DN6282_c0_g1_i1:34-1485(-)
MWGSSSLWGDHSQHSRFWDSSEVSGEASRSRSFSMDAPSWGDSTTSPMATPPLSPSVRLGHRTSVSSIPISPNSTSNGLSVGDGESDAQTQEEVEEDFKDLLFELDSSTTSLVKPFLPPDPDTDSPSPSPPLPPLSSSPASPSPLSGILTLTHASEFSSSGVSLSGPGGGGGGDPRLTNGRRSHPSTSFLVSRGGGNIRPLSLRRPLKNSKGQFLCVFHLEGTCRYGMSCRNVHGRYCNICNKPALFPDDDVQNEEHLHECLDKQRLKESLEDAKRFTCQRCHLKVVEQGHRFGILTDCTHCFCLPCIKEWRTESQSSDCPVCDATSHYVVPSNEMVVDPSRKYKIIQRYKEKMKEIPCKYYDGGRGSCKFGSNCHYAHRGDVSDPKRQLTDAEGEPVTVNSLNLGMFMTPGRKRHGITRAQMQRKSNRSTSNHTHSRLSPSIIPSPATVTGAGPASSASRVPKIPSGGRVRRVLGRAVAKGE